MPQTLSLPGTTDKRLAALLTLLSENATIVISGARIAREIGVSRSTVWRWVEELRKLGGHLKGQRSTGYFLEKVPDILTPDLLRKRLKGSLFGKRVHHFFKTDSTNRVAMELGYADEPEGAVVLGEEQRAGGEELAFGAGSWALCDSAAAAEAFAGAGAAVDDARGTFASYGGAGADGS